jgi:ABC-type dipeptide/oligopeptide/nickel transport system permease component
MLKYILKRLFYAIFVLLGVATIVFFLTRLTGDPVSIMLPPDAGQEQIDQLRTTLGLNKPLIVQYLIYLKNLLHFDFGMSLRYFEPASNLLLEKLPATLKLAGAAMLISLCVAIPAGIIAALKKGSSIDQGIMVIVMAGQSMPVFWVGILLIMLFSVQLRWLPTGGYGGLKYIIMPSIALGFNLMTLTTRLLRSSLIEVMETDYIRTARAKGLKSKAVIMKHAFRNSLLPVVTVIGLQMGALLGGSVVTETVFAWPGVGQMLVQAIQYRDFPLVQATIITLAGAFVLINLIVDILYVFIDPRIHLT